MGFSDATAAGWQYCNTQDHPPAGGRAAGHNRDLAGSIQQERSTRAPTMLTVVITDPEPSL
jgi:hypothetical protein